MRDAVANLSGVYDERISPELVLVDPELATRARAALPERPPWPPPRVRHVPPRARPVPPPVTRPRPTAHAPTLRPRYPLWARVVAAVWLLVFGILIGGAAVPHAQDRPRVVPAAEDVCEMPPPEPSTTRPALPPRALPGAATP